MKKLVVMAIVGIMVMAMMFTTACGSKKSDTTDVRVEMIEIGEDAAEKAGYVWTKITFYGSDYFETLRMAEESANWHLKDGYLVTEIVVETEHEGKIKACSFKYGTLAVAG
jgi:hypothetical protein